MYPKLPTCSFFSQTQVLSGAEEMEESVHDAIWGHAERHAELMITQGPPGYKQTQNPKP